MRSCPVCCPVEIVGDIIMWKSGCAFFLLSLIFPFPRLLNSKWFVLLSTIMAASSPQMGQMVAQIMPHLPKLLALATEAPAFITGYLLAFIYLVIWIGPTAFKRSFAPISGFHLVGLVLCGLFWRSVAVGYRKLLVMRKRRQGANSIVSDLLLLSHEPKLD